MFNKTMVATGVAIAVAAMPVVAEEGSFMDELEISGELKNESAIFTKSGTTVGAASAHDNRDMLKSETSLRLFVNGLAGESSEWHAEIRPVRDTQAVDGYKGHENYSQQDFLRELYVDTTAGEDDAVSLRIGKQQVVWGTADGMKLLDIINPTDYREMAQNSMDESRIPVWMITAETDLENGANVQGVIFQPESNKLAGLSTLTSGSTFNSTANRNGSGLIGGGGGGGSMDHSLIKGTDQGHAFVMKGVDSVTGKSNGILNIVPELAEVASTFAMLSSGFANNNNNATFHLQNWTHANVNDFVTNKGFGAGFGGACPQWGINVADGANSASSAQCLYTIAEDTNQGTANLIDSSATPTVGTTAGSVGQGAGGDVAGDWDAVNPNSTFEYMSDATFATFATFTSASSKYIREEPTGANFGFRFKNTLPSGLNYSVNVTRQYDANPYLTMEWQNNAGATLNVEKQTDNSGNNTGYTTIRLKDSGGTWHNGDGQTPVYGYAGTGAGAASTPVFNPVTLVIKEKYAETLNLGTAFDTAVETEVLGSVIVRGEFLYQQDAMQPIVNKAEMKVGNITEALSSIEADHFKYVLGADITVLTNMMVSAQFIQDRNLDYVDETVTVGNSTGQRYTGDMATMHLTNGYNKAEKNKEFYSLFFSKPFGAEQQHRWNNIIMFEENGGKWNRADVEYSFSDEIIGSAEYNKYWGDENTQFGQLEKSSNFQLGLKYIF
jgi:hypothetical protein